MTWKDLTKMYMIAWIEFIGVIVFAIGAGSLVGHITSHENLYKWDSGDPGMAINTAIALTISGIATFVIGAWIKNHEKRHRKI